MASGYTAKTMNDQDWSYVQVVRDSSYALIEHFHRPFMDGDTSIPDFHIQIANKMKSPDKWQTAIAVPRGHAKTTIAKLVTVWYLLFTDYTFPLYVSDTHDVASSAVQDIWTYLISDEFVALTGELPGRIGATQSTKGRIVEQASRGIYQFRMRYYKPGRPLTERHYKTVNLVARGANQQIRGTNKAHARPDLLIMDDVESQEVLNNEETFRKFSVWMYGTLFKALATKRKRIIQIGNLIDYNSMLMRHLENEAWASMRMGVLKSDFTPLWPEVWPVSAIKADYKQYADVGQLSTWYAEMMNTPYSPDQGIVDLGKVQYIKRPDPADDRIKAAFLSIDPAISDGSHADRCALVVNLIMDDGVLVHAETVARKGMAFDEIYAQAIRLCEKWNSNLVFIENVAFQAVLVDVFKMLSIGSGKSHMKFVPISVAKIAKIARLTAWAGMLHSGVVKLCYGETEITGELGRFDRRKTNNGDDVIDACSQATRALGLFSSLIYQSKVITTEKSRAVKTTESSV